MQVEELTTGEVAELFAELREEKGSEWVDAALAVEQEMCQTWVINYDKDGGGELKGKYVQSKLLAFVDGEVFRFEEMGKVSGEPGSTIEALRIALAARAARSAVLARCGKLPVAA